MSEFSKVAGYDIQTMQKSVAFPYTNNEMSENIKNSI